MKNEIINTGGISQLFQGFYKVAAVDGMTNEVKYETDWNKNLILNQGMDAINSQYIADLTKYAVGGTGIRTNNIAGGDSTITQTGATITLTPFPITGLSDFTSSYLNYPFGSAEVGDMLIYSTSESRVTAVNPNGINLTVTPSYTIPSASGFVIWKTSQVGLNDEKRRAGTDIAGTSYLPGIGNCGTTSGSVTSSILTHRRTYDFVTESSARTYTEIGTSWDSTAFSNTTVFSRVVLPVGIVVSSSYKLRVVYDLRVSFSPTASTAKHPTISGWDDTKTWGTESIQNLLTSYVLTNGNTQNIGVGTGVSLDPAAQSTNCNFWGSSNSQSLATFPLAVSRTADQAFSAAVKSVYVPLSFYTDKSATFGTGILNITRIRSVGFGHSGNATDTTNQAFCFRFDSEQTKSNTQTLTLTYRTTWGRVLQ